MPVIAVVNRKGGSGKSTLATHLAAHCANRGILSMLGDIDRQQSTQTWLRLRATQHLPRSAPILGWALDPRNVMRAPSGITHVILDTPGGLRGFDLARVVGYADVVLMPVCSSVFDRESAAQCHAELMALPRVASGRCRVAAVGMRLDARTKADETLAAWAEEHDIDYLGALRETQAYVKTIEQGLSVFDLPAAKVQVDLAQWAPVLDWLEPLLLGNAAPEEQPAADEGHAGTGRDASHGGGAVKVLVPTSMTLPRPIATASNAAPPANPPREAEGHLALAQAARDTLRLPSNLGELPSGTGLKERLSRWLGSLGGRIATPL